MADFCGHAPAHGDAFSRGISSDALHDARTAESGQYVLGGRSIRQSAQNDAQHQGLLLH
jgi:hypothetical protein